MAWKQTVNKTAAKPAVPKPKFDTKDDDWDTDISYEVLFEIFDIIFKSFSNRITQLKNHNVMVQKVYRVRVESIMLILVLFKKK